MKNHLSMTPLIMRLINRTAVLEYIRKHGCSSRAVISKNLDLSLPSVVRIVDELIDEKLLRYKGGHEDSGGRPRPLIELATDENIAIGLDLGGTKAAACIVNYNGDILFEHIVKLHNTEGEESYKLVHDLISEMTTHAKSLNKIIRGISVGVPGVTDHRAGKVVFAPSLDWKDFPLQERLKNDFGMPVIVENDVNMAALGEMWFGSGKTLSNLVLIALGTGVGAGVIIDGCIYRGSNESAGELGYMVFQKEELDQKYPKFGPLEYAIAGTGLAIQTKEALKGVCTEDELTKITAKNLFEAYNQGEEWTVNIISDFVDKLAMTIISVSSFIDPEMIVLSGGVMDSAKVIFPRLKELIKDKIPENTLLEVSELGARATILGGAVSLLYQSNNYCILRYMSERR